MRLRNMILGAMSGVLLATGLTVVTAAPAAAAPVCEVGWVRQPTGLRNFTSAWIRTRADITGKARSVQFRITSVPQAKWRYSNCHLSATRKFPTAIQYRVSDRTGIHGWVYYRPSVPKRGYKYPDKCVGWDVIAGMWRVWNCL